MLQWIPYYNILYLFFHITCIKIHNLPITKFVIQISLHLYQQNFYLSRVLHVSEVLPKHFETLRI